MSGSEYNTRKVFVIYKDKQEEEIEKEKNKIKFQYNNLSELEYLKYPVLKMPEELNRPERQFLSEVDKTDIYPIIRKVEKIFRELQPDLDDKYERPKEFLTWYETWQGKDRYGKPIKPVSDHKQGVYKEIIIEDVFDKAGDVIGQRMKGTRLRYTTPFSKKAVDDIIATSQGSTKDTITYCLRLPTFRTAGFNYKQYTESPRELIEEMAMCDGGPKNWEYRNNKFVKERQDFIKKFGQAVT